MLRTILILYTFYFVSVFTAPTCMTIANSISQVTDCFNNVCSAHYSTVVTTTLDQGFSSCIKFAALENDNETLLEEYQFSLDVMKSGFNVPIDLQYVTGDYHVTFDSLCSCNIFAPASSCNTMNFTSVPKIEFCLPAAMWTDTCTIHKDYDFYLRIGMDLPPRYKVFLTRNFIPEINLVWKFDNLTAGVLWNGITPTHVPIDASMGFDLLSTSTSTAIKYPKYLVLDMLNPTDLYDASNFNTAGEFSPSKLGSAYWFPDGTFKSRNIIYLDRMHPTLIKCDHEKTRSTLEVDLDRIDEFLENKRKINDSMRNMFPRLNFYDENSYSENDYWSSGNKIASHLSGNQVYYGKQGSQIFVRNYIEVISEDGIFHTIGNLAGSIFTCYMDGANAYTGTTYYFKGCNDSINWLYCSATTGWGWKDSENSGGSFVTTTMYYTDWDGECKSSLMGLAIPEFVPDHTAKHHMFVPTTVPGSMTYRVYGKIEGITFTKQLCPEIQSVKDDPIAHVIRLTARSTCGSGVAIVTTNNSLSHQSQTLDLTGTYKLFILPRVSNMSDIVEVGITSGEDKVAVNVKLSTFKYIPPSDEQDHDVDEVPTPDDGKSEPSIFGSWSDFWKHIKDAFSWKFGSWQSIIFKIVFLIIFIILCILALVILYKIIKYFIIKMWKMNPIKFSFNRSSVEPTSKVKYL